MLSPSAPPAGWAGEVEPHTLKPLVVFQQIPPTPALWPALCRAGVGGTEEGDPGLLGCRGLDTNAAVLVPWGTFWEGGESLLTPEVEEGSLTTKKAPGGCRTRA